MTPWGFAVWPYIGGELLNLASDSVVFLVLVLVFFFVVIVGKDKESKY